MGIAVDRDQVAQHYRTKGYQVHASMVLEGRSGSHRIPMLCEGPLGNLTVFFGDAGGIDEREIGSAKRIARDLGATAVVAAAHFTTDQRKTAAGLGVVLLDDAMLGMAPQAPAAPRTAWPVATTPHETLARDLAAHPWPDSGRPGGFGGPHRAVTYEVEELLAHFDANRSAPPAASRPPPAPGPTLAAQDAPATVDLTPSTAPTPARASPSSTAQLWKHPRAGRAGPDASTPESPPTGVAAGTPTPRTATRFAWLNLPKPAEPSPDAEYEDTVPAHAAHAAQAGTWNAAASQATTRTTTPAATAKARGRSVDPQALARRRVWLRRAAWMAAGALFAYLFLLWWF